jgi:putative membrane protein
VSHNRIKSAATAALFGLVPAATSAQTQPNGYYWHHPYMMGDGGWLAMVLGPIFMLVPLAVLIAVVVFVIRWAGGPWRAGDRPPERTPLDILKERFARGEIDKEEYEERRRVLSE